jgi:hypothetical protein
MASEPTTIPVATPRDDATIVSRDSSDVSPLPDNTSKKRKYEEATEDEKLALFKYHSENPNLKQASTPHPRNPYPRTAADGPCAERVGRLVSNDLRKVDQPVNRLAKPQKVQVRHFTP